MAGCLIVPINVQALVLGEKGRNEVSAQVFVKREFSFELLGVEGGASSAGASGRLRPYLSGRCLRREFDDLTSLEAGIHLHWTIPDALARGVVEGGEASFPKAPNRWLITRVWRQGGAERYRSWMQESDRVYQKLENGTVIESVTAIPVENPSGYPFHQYLGKAFEAGKTEPPETYLEDFNVMGWGSPTFASYYPNCRGVFGFHDPASDLARAGTTIVAYSIVGWHSDGADDPARKANSRRGADPDFDLAKELADSYRWKVAKAPAGGFEGTAYGGGIAGIAYDPGASYLSDAIPSGLVGKHSVAMGLTDKEAIAALLSSGEGVKDAEETERYLLAAQSESGEGVMDIERAVKADQFSIQGGGTEWVIKAREKEDGIPGAAAEPTSDKLSIEEGAAPPEEAVAALASLSSLQEERDAMERELESLRSQLFVDWNFRAQLQHGDLDDHAIYAVIKHSDPSSNQSTLNENFRELAAGKGSADFDKDLGGYRSKILAEVVDPYLSAVVARINALIREIFLKTYEISKACAKVERSLSSSRFALLRREAPRFYAPTSPVVIIRAEGEPWSYAGERNRAGLTESGELPCRADADILAGPAGIAAPELAAGIPGYVPAARLILETAIIMSGKAESASGTRPHEIADTRWKGRTPWMPMAFEWQAECFPLKKSSSDSSRYSERFMLDNFSADEKLSLMATEKSAFAVESETHQGYRIYKGGGFLTPSGRDALIQTVNRLSKKSPNGPDPDAYEKGLKGVTLLSQCLDGFNDACLMVKRGYQLKAMDPDFPDDKFAAEIDTAIGRMNDRAPLPGIHFLPIMNGLFRLTRLRVIDVFGRYADLIEPETWTGVRYSKSLRLPPGLPSAVPGFPACVPPRMVFPARVNFKFLAGDSRKADLGAHRPETPVRAWLMPDFIGGSLSAYRPDGAPIGTIRLCGKKTERHPALRISDSGSVEAVDDRDSPIEGLLSAMERSADYFLGVMECLDKSTRLMNRGSDSSLASILGHPLAVVRASLGLEAYGLPPIDLDWESVLGDFATPVKDPAERFLKDRARLSQVRFPVRVGDFHARDDGLAGFFFAGQFDEFHAQAPLSRPVPGEAGAPRIVEHTGVELALGDYRGPGGSVPETVELDLIMDPHLPVRAVSGFLPEKAVQLPPGAFADSIKRINVSFFAGPAIVGAGGGLDLPVPGVHGQRWSFAEHVAASLDPSSFRRFEDAGQSMESAPFAHGSRIGEGWILAEPKGEGHADDIEG